MTVRVTDSGGPALYASETITINVVNGVPSPWTTQDLGSVGLTGSAAYVNGSFLVAGAGADIWGTADAFRFVYQPASGDCSVTAKVTSLQNTHSSAKAGVMIRESLAPNSIQMATVCEYSGGIDFLNRLTTGGSTSQTRVATFAVPYWVRITRVGNVFSSYRSPDGVTWTQIGASQTVTMASGVYIGIGVCSKSTTTLNNASLTNVTAVP